MARKALHLSLQRKVINKSIFLIALVQPLSTVPQVITVFSSHNATSLSILSWLLYVIFDLAWLWYGIDEKQKAIIVSAAMFSFLELLVLIGAILYGGHWSI